MNGTICDMKCVYRRCIGNLGEGCRKYDLKINIGQRELSYLVENIWHFTQVI